LHGQNWGRRAKDKSGEGTETGASKGATGDGSGQTCKNPGCFLLRKAENEVIGKKGHWSDGKRLFGREKVKKLVFKVIAYEFEKEGVKNDRGKAGKDRRGNSKTTEWDRAKYTKGG